MISKKIHYFITLAECLNFTQTAAKYEISQTAVSQYIASLEERLGVKLFTRTQRSVVLTDAGQYYYEHVRQILQEYEDTLTNVHAIAESYHGYLKVGIGMYEYCSTERFFSAFLKAHPEIKVDILQYPYSTLTEQLRTGELDIIIGDALCENAFSRHELMSRTLFSSPNYIVAEASVADRYGDDLAGMLHHECLITNCEEDGPSSLGMLRRLLMDELGFVPENIAQTNSINAQLMIVRAAHGVAIVPGFVADVQAPDLVRYPLPEHRDVHYQVMKLRNANNPFADLMYEFRPET